MGEKETMSGAREGVKTPAHVEVPNLESTGMSQPEEAARQHEKWIDSGASARVGYDVYLKEGKNLSRER